MQIIWSHEILIILKRFEIKYLPYFKGLLCAWVFILIRDYFRIIKSASKIHLEKNNFKLIKLSFWVRAIEELECIMVFFIWALKWTGRGYIRHGVLGMSQPSPTFSFWFLSTRYILHIAYALVAIVICRLFFFYYGHLTLKMSQDLREFLWATITGSLV